MISEAEKFVLAALKLMRPNRVSAEIIILEKRSQDIIFSDLPDFRII